MRRLLVILSVISIGFISCSKENVEPKLSEPTPQMSEVAPQSGSEKEDDFNYYGGSEQEVDGLFIVRGSTKQVNTKKAEEKAKENGN